MSTHNSLMVTILEREYRVASPPGQEDKLEAAARLLDKKMKDIRATGKVIGIERIAVMAGLNLAHELLALAPANQQDQAVVERLMTKIDKALTEK